MKDTNYPGWICSRCGNRYGKGMPEGHRYTVHTGTCGICGVRAAVTEPRDYGHLKPGWLQMLKRDQSRELRILRAGKFKPCDKGDIRDRCDRMYWNLWGMFSLTKRSVVKLKVTEPQLSVTDFAWTEEVEKAFYAHPYHRALVRKLNKQYAMSFAIWKLQSEPRTLVV